MSAGGGPAVSGTGGGSAVKVVAKPALCGVLRQGRVEGLGIQSRP
jgi:hypothetical protein